MGTGNVGHLDQETLSAFADDELQPAEADAARRHLAACAACHAELAAFAELDQALAAAPALSCAAALPLVSAEIDGESDSHETAAATMHLTTCGSCRELRQAWLATEVAIRELPVALPSARVDAAMAALAKRDQRRGAPDWRRVAAVPVVGGGLVAVGVSAAMVIATVGQPRTQISLQPAPQLGAVNAQVGPLAVQEVLNTRTNTLYSLRPAQNQVAALDPFSKLTRATISVPAKPVTLAVNEDANKVYVLDVQRSLVEIDGDTNTVTSTTPNVVDGEPTAISYDAVKQQIVVAAQAPRATAAPTAAPTQGVVAVVDVATKTVLQSRTVDAVPQTVVLDDTGTRALLVSKDAATIVDAATYQLSIRLPGGVAGAFGASKGPVAIITASNGGTRLAFFGNAAPAPVDLEGAPVAIASTPDGAFGVLVKTGDKGRVYVVDAAGKIAQLLDVAASGPSLVYDANAKQFAIVGADVTFAAAPTTAPVVTAPSPSASAAPTAQPSATASAKPSASPTASAQPAPSPTEAPVAAAKPSAAPLPAPAGATLAWTGTYRVELPYGKHVSIAAIDPQKKRIWFVDQNRTLNAMSTTDYKIFPVAQLPGGANIDALVVGYTHVYAIDKAGVQLYDLALPSEILSPQSMGLLRDGVGFSVTPDDRLWFGRGSQLMSYDPRVKRVSVIDTTATAIAMVTTDSAARVWYAGAGDKLGVYDARTELLTEFSLPRRGTPTAMTVDGSGQAWIATNAGELFAVSGGQLALTAHVPAPITTFASGSTSLAWGLSSGTAATSYAPVDGSRTRTVVPGAISAFFFDAQGRVWLTDRTSGFFYVTEAAP